METNNNVYNLSDEYTMYLNKKFGSGTFGQIYKIKNKKTNMYYAGKTEPITNTAPQLMNEYHVFTSMKGKTGFPNVYKIIKTKKEQIMIMDILGKNLDEIMQSLTSNKYSMKSALLIAEQMLTRIKDLHSSGYIHRDLKPENFLIGNKGNEKTIFLIDLGLSKKYINDKGEHIPLKDNLPVIGTVRYTSMNSHQGHEQSRRDDLESLCYIFIYFIMGELPWQGQKCKLKKEQYDKIYATKKETVPKELCQFLPEEIKSFLQYILKLRFSDTPNYNFLFDLLHKLMSKYGYSYDGQFDWMVPGFLDKLYSDCKELYDNGHIPPVNKLSDETICKSNLLENNNLKTKNNSNKEVITLSKIKNNMAIYELSKEELNLINSCRNLNNNHTYINNKVELNNKKSLFASKTGNSGDANKYYNSYVNANIKNTKSLGNSSSNKNK